MNMHLFVQIIYCDKINLVAARVDEMTRKNMKKDSKKC